MYQVTLYLNSPERERGFSNFVYVYVYYTKTNLTAGPSLLNFVLFYSVSAQLLADEKTCIVLGLCCR